MLEIVVSVVSWTTNGLILLSWFPQHGGAARVYDAVLPYIWVGMFLIAALDIFAGGTWEVVVYAILSVLWYYIWRNNRRNKKRKKSRVLGAVVNLGHRLTVRPVPASTS